MKSNIIKELSRHPEFTTFCELGKSIFGVKVTISDPEGVHNAPNEQTPFCSAMQEAESVNRKCVECDRRHLHIARNQKEPLRYRCHFGLAEIVVPVLVDTDVVAFLWCGQVFDRKPTRKDWHLLRAKLGDSGLDLSHIEKMFFRVKVISEKRQREMAQMAGLFASHLAYTSHRIAILQQHTNSRCVMLAKSFVKTELSEPITLNDVARAANSSVRNLTRVFLVETNMTVMDYIRSLRVERARELLLHTDIPVTTVAFDVGFGTIQQFNRVFKAVNKCTPTFWREANGKP